MAAKDAATVLQTAFFAVNNETSTFVGMKIVSILLVVCAFLFSACTKKQTKGNSYFFDYEQAAGWSQVQLEAGFANSGRYCEKITPDKVYSNTFILSLAEAGSKNLKKVKASVWITAPEIQQDLKLVIDMYSPAESKSVKNIYMPIAAASLQGKANWVQFTTELDIADITDGSVITKVYVWNPGGQKFFVDDFFISFQ